MPFKIRSLSIHTHTHTHEQTHTRAANGGADADGCRCDRPRRGWDTANIACAETASNLYPGSAPVPPTPPPSIVK